MTVLIDLPDETIIYILSLSEPQAVARCQQLCHKLRSLITTSPLLTYVLTLHSLGYALPSVLRPDLTLPECVVILQEHHLRWTRIHTLRATRYDLDATRYSRSHYVGGVYAHGIPGSWMGHLHTMHFYQLESKNLGTGFKKWTLHDLGRGANPNLADFTIDPEQDLLVLVESAISHAYPSPDSLPNDECRLHFRTMSTGEAHPKALEPVMSVNLAAAADLESQQSDSDEEERLVAAPHRAYRFEVSGPLVKVQFQTLHGTAQQWIVIHDWCRGVEITRIPIYESQCPSSVLLTQGAILIPRYSTTPELSSQGLDALNACGSLDLYTFDPSSDSSTPSHVIASFGLPDLPDSNHEVSDVVIECASSAKSQAVNGSSKPKVYDLSPRDRLISLRLTVRPKLQPIGIISTGTLCMPLSVFTHALATYGSQAQGAHRVKMFPEPTRVPWHVWAHRTSWVDTGDINIIPTNSNGPTFGHRLAVPWIPDGRSNTWTTEVLLVDLNQRRLSWEEECAGGKGSTPISNAGINNIHAGVQSGRAVNGEVIGRGIFCREGISAQIICTPTITPIDEAMNCQTDDVYMDTEHIIVARHPRVFYYGREPQEEGSLSIYTF